MSKYPGKAWFKASADRDDFDDSPHPFEAEDVFPDRRPPWDGVGWGGMGWDGVGWGGTLTFM